MALNFLLFWMTFTVWKLISCSSICKWRWIFSYHGWPLPLESLKAALWFVNGAEFSLYCWDTNPELLKLFYALASIFNGFYYKETFPHIYYYHWWWRHSDKAASLIHHQCGLLLSFCSSLAPVWKWSWHLSLSLMIFTVDLMFQRGSYLE